MGPQRCAVTFLILCWSDRPGPRPRSAAVLSSCLCCSINVNGLRSARRELFFPGAAVGAPRSAHPARLPKSVARSHSRPSPSPGQDLPAAALPAWGIAEPESTLASGSAVGGEAERCVLERTLVLAALGGVRGRDWGALGPGVNGPRAGEGEGVGPGALE